MIQISPHILQEAHLVLSGLNESQASLPIRLESAQMFYVAAIDDGSIHAFGVIHEGGVTYKIGTLKVVAT